MSFSFHVTLFSIYTNVLLYAIYEKSTCTTGRVYNQSCACWMSTTIRWDLKDGVTNFSAGGSELLKVSRGKLDVSRYRALVGVNWRPLTIEHGPNLNSFSPMIE